MTNCDAVSVALIVQKRPMTVATSSPLALEADLVQYREQEGPCLTTVEIAKRVRIDVLEHDERYQHFAPGAIELGVESVLSVPITYDERVVGSFNLYSRTPHGFADVITENVEAMALYAGELIARSPLYAYAADLVDAIAEWIEDVDVIALAVGILIARHSISAEDARSHLELLAFADDLTLHDAAIQIIGELTEGDDQNRPEPPTSGHTDPN